MYTFLFPNKVGTRALLHYLPPARPFYSNRDVTHFTTIYKKITPQNPLSGFCFGHLMKDKGSRNIYIYIFFS